MTIGNLKKKEIYRLIILTGIRNIPFIWSTKVVDEIFWIWFKMSLGGRPGKVRTCATGLFCYCSFCGEEKTLHKINWQFFATVFANINYISLISNGIYNIISLYIFSILASSITKTRKPDSVTFHTLP